ncbi:MAG: PQQ-binding-like beta-propeller repeat protein [Planctomycetales bacterium]
MNAIRSAIFAGLAAALLATASGRGDDWPQWRGPERDGAWNEAGVSEAFPAGGPPVRWRVPVGPGWSSPIVAAGRVYLTDARLDAPRADERVLCFDAETGKPRWDHSYPVTYPEWAFPARGPTATPLVREGKLYTLGNKGNLHCFDAARGNVLWTRDLEADYQLQEFAFNSSPLVEGNLLVLSIGTYMGKSPACVLALDRHTGEEQWKALGESLTNSSPIVVSAGGRRQLVVWTQESVSSLDPATGETLWREPMKTQAASAVATPVCRGNRLYAGGLMFELEAGRPAATVLWPATRAVSRRVLSNTSTALLRGDQLFSARSSGELVCLDAATGRELWTTDKATAARSGASIHLTPNGDSVFLFTDEGNLVRARPTAEGYEELGRAHLIEPTGSWKVTWAHPAYSGRSLFVRNDKELICVSLAAEGER